MVIIVKELTAPPHVTHIHHAHSDDTTRSHHTHVVQQATETSGGLLLCVAYSCTDALTRAMTTLVHGCHDESDDDRSEGSKD